MRNGKGKKKKEKERKGAKQYESESHISAC